MDRASGKRITELRRKREKGEERGWRRERGVGDVECATSRRIFRVLFIFDQIFRVVCSIEMTTMTATMTMRR